MNCFGSVNLRNKNYYFFNEKLSKEEYEKKLQEYKLHTREGLERAFNETRAFVNKFPNRYLHGTKNLNSTGSYVTD